eukprot:g3222.t1
MISLEGAYPFDGNCELSKDADFALTFEDKSSLKVTNCLLRESSQILEATINKSGSNGRLPLANTSKDAWVMILNYIHPGGRYDSYARYIIPSKRDVMEDVLRQCEIFNFALLRQDIDGRLARALYTAEPALDSDLCTDSKILSTFLFNMGLPTAIKTCDLPRSEEALASYLTKYVSENRASYRREVSSNKYKANERFASVTNCIRNIMNQVQVAGRYRVESAFVEAILEEELSLFDE